MIGITNARIVLENGILWNGTLLIEGDTILDYGDASEISVPEGAQVIDAQGAYVGPGFVDLHVHGGNGHFFYKDPVQAARHFLSHGETSVLATLYYDLSKDEFCESIGRVQEAMKGSDPAARAIAGFYMEGPYMNPKFGAAASLNKWRGPVLQEQYQAIVDLAGTDAKVWAVAPEREGLAPFLAYAKKVNPHVVFAVGHSEASPEQVEAIKPYGLRLQTHCTDATGSVSKYTGTRGCGPDEACWLDDSMYAEVICDSCGIHVNPYMLRLILKIKGADRTVLITDSYVTDKPSPPELAHITDLVFDAAGLINGSKLTLDVACHNMMTHTGCGVCDAFKMASLNPARAIGMDDAIGSIRRGKRANLVFVSDTFFVQRVMLGGKLFDND